MPRTEIQNLLECFGQEQACYTSLMDLSRIQKRVIAEGDVDRLLQILGQKQRILADVGAIEARVAPYKRTWQAFRNTLDESERQVLELALTTVEELLAELISLEKESEELLVQKRDEAEQDVVSAVRNQNVHRAYSTPVTTPDSRYLDVRSDLP